MSLIAMCVYCTKTNDRADYLRRCIYSLHNTVDFTKHRLVLIINGTTIQSERFIDFAKKTLGATIIRPNENIGTARGINMALALRNDGENCIKCDEDVVWHENGWADQLEEVIKIDQTIGIVGLKRKDLRQTPYDPDPSFKSELRQLPHLPGERWIIVEETNDIMGTCTMLSSNLLDKIGGYYQGEGNVYAFDDTLINLRAGLAGFKKCFLPHIEIDHIDTGGSPYSQEKIELANKAWPGYHLLHQAYIEGTRPLFEAL